MNAPKAHRPTSPSTVTKETSTVIPLHRRTRRLASALALGLMLGAVGALPPAAAQAASPAFQITTIPQAGHLPPGGQAIYSVLVENVGSAPTDGSAVTITDQLPSGLSLDSAGSQTLNLSGDSFNAAAATCAPGPPPSCTAPTGTAITSILYPGEVYGMIVPVTVDAGLDGSDVTNHITVSGGGAAPASLDTTTPVSATDAPFDFTGAYTSFTDADAGPAAQAGSHPYQLTAFFQFNDVMLGADRSIPAASFKDLAVKLPPGVVVNPQATPKCTEAQLESHFSDNNVNDCPDASAVGYLRPLVHIGPFPFPAVNGSLNDMEPPPGSPAEIAFQISPFGAPVYGHIEGSVDSAGNYQLGGTLSDLSNYGVPSGADVELWGDPADPAHDYRRGSCEGGVTAQAAETCPVPHSSADVPFLSMPTSCAGDPLLTDFSANSWQDPGNFVNTSAPATDAAGNTFTTSGCAALDFQPTLQARPTTNVADSPTGLSVDLGVPQTDSVGQLATAHLRKAVVTLPPGLVVNPSGANGLGACSSAQVGLSTPVGQADPIHFSADPAGCPDAAKIGTVQVDTPLLDHPLPGAVYIAKPYDNPFDSLLAIYIVVEDPSTGVVIKLAGHVVPDPQSGQLVTSFDQNPQLPFSHFKLSFFGGDHATLRTPATCGAYSTTSELTPYSAPDTGAPTTPHDDYSIDQGPNGACAASAADQPNAPSFDAGTVSPVAGQFSPFVLNLSRADGSQQFSKVITSPPPGLVAKLAGTPACPDAALSAAASKSGQDEQASPSCPAASQVGTVHVAAGAGPSPYWTTGTAYMAGPYGGEPLSLAIITPATAGPFDLGTVVTRVALHIDPTTAQITATSDPIPSILQGIPLDVRSVRVALDKPNFTLNGTSCDVSAVTGSELSTLGNAASLSQRFQLSECANLPFKPKLGLRLRGGHFRNGHPALTTVLSARNGDADLGRAQVILPPSMQLDQSHIQAPCTRPQFAADQCPAASVIGSVVATSPLLDYKLTGPVYLRTGDNPLPDVVLDLHGPASQPIRIDQVGKIDTVHARLRTTFQSVPDAPISQAIIRLVGGHKGLLVNNTNLCKQSNRAAVFLDAHNGKTADSTPRIALRCPKARKHKRHHRKHKRHHRRHHLRHRRAVG